MIVAKLLQQPRRAQEEMDRTLSYLEGEGTAGGGLVRVRLNGLKERRGVGIHRVVLVGENAALLGDLIVAAWEGATGRLAGATNQALGSLGQPAELASFQ